MKDGLAERESVKPILVLGLGNSLLGDDGVGLELLKRVREVFAGEEAIEFLDGGTRGISLCGYLVGREFLVILDAVVLGASPGTVHVIEDPQSSSFSRGLSAHEGNAGEILQAAVLTGDLPSRVVLIGIEPHTLKTGIGLSPPTTRALPYSQRICARILGDCV